MADEEFNYRLREIVEAALFVSEEPLRAAELAKVTPVDGSKIRQIMIELRDEYEANNRGMQLLEISGGFKMTTREEHYPVLEKLFGRQTRARLSNSAIETLVIVAYYQPVTRAEVEALRGVNSQSVLNTLLDKNFIRIKGRRDEIGRPMEYSTTSKFLDYFGLGSLNDLPDEDEVKMFSLEEAEND